MAKTREQMLAELRASRKVQAIIVGGGINGISVFRELALQGIRSLLVDRGDFCGGCSSAPSRMIHGGLRYLENGEIGLVREALRERDALLRNAPHFVRPLPTTVPIHHLFSGFLNGAFKMLRLRSEPAERGAVAVKLGLALYDWLASGKRSMPRHEFHGKKQTTARWPGFPGSVRFSATYYDAWISYPERLGIELIDDAVSSNSHALAINHLGVKGRDGDRIVLAEAQTREELSITADIIINAAGAWVDELNSALSQSPERGDPLVGGTKGSHLILDHPDLRSALQGHMVYFENADGRVCILFPYLGRVLLGSTDIRVESPDDIRCESEEVEYILKSLDYVFPGMEVRPENIIYRYSGVRPLPRSDAVFTGSISRDHYIAEIAGAPPVLCLVGGKWTTFRSFGEEAADRALSLLGMKRILRTSDRPIGGGTEFPRDGTGYEALLESLTKEFGISRDRAAHALDLYGTSGRKVLEFSRSDTEEALGNTSYSVAELRYLIRHEHARTLSDLLQRRTSLAITGRLSSRIIQRAVQVLAEELGLSQQQACEEEVGFRALLSRDHGLTDAILAERDPKPARSLACA